MIKAILFDYGGVLAKGGRKDSAKAAIEQYYGRELPRDTYERLQIAMRAGQLTTSEYLNAFRDVAGAATAMTEAEWHAALADQYELLPQVYDLASRLRAAGMRTGIISNIHRFEARHIERLGGYDGFDPVVLSADVRMLKPDPEIFQLALERLAVPAERALFVDDQERLVRAAQELGMHGIRAVSPDQIVCDVTALVLRENGIEL